MFDIGFTRFSSNMWISLLWCICIIVHFLAAIGAVYYAFFISGNEDLAILSLLVVPLATIFSLISWRMAFELDVVCFRIESNTRESKESLQAIEAHLQAIRKNSEKETDREKKDMEDLFHNFVIPEKTGI